MVLVAAGPRVQEGDRRDGVLPLDAQPLLPGGHLPDAAGAVAASRHDVEAVGAEDGIPNPSRVPLQGGDLRETLCVRPPEVHRRVRGGRREHLQFSTSIAYLNYEYGLQRISVKRVSNYFREITDFEVPRTSVGFLAVRAGIQRDCGRSGQMRTFASGLKTVHKM